MGPCVNDCGIRAWIRQRSTSEGTTNLSKQIGSEALELSAELLEPALDALTDNEILKDVPVLGIAVKVAGIGKSISDRIFLAKVKRFLDAIDPATIKEARHFAARLAAGESDAKRTAEAVVLALDDINDLAKAPMLAAIFAALLRGEMSPADFRRISAAVNAAVVDDLVALAALGPDPSGKSDDYAAVVNAMRHTGLTDSTVHNVVTSNRVDLTEAVTPLGKAFAQALKTFGERK